MPQDIIEKLKKEIEDWNPHTTKEDIGHVLSFGDGVANIEGLSHAKMSEMVVFELVKDKNIEESLKEKRELLGVVLNIEEDTIKAVVLGNSKNVKEGTVVRGTGKILSLPVGHGLLGRVINPLGEPLDEGPGIKAEAEYPIEKRAPGVIERKSVSVPLHTGIKAVDAMIPVGRGQRELIIGDRQTGKTTLAIDAILNQLHEPADKRPICIYVAIGQKESKVARLVTLLKKQGAMEYSIVVSASASDAAALQFLAPYAGAAIGEFFMDQGRDALVIYDDLSKHAVAYRQMSLILRRPPGREAYPGDIFYLHSRLLERAARLSEEYGGGSLTALPIIETQEGDVSAYIPTNVISITDGQIYLETDLFNKGIRPAINVGISVSRVGSSAQTKAMKKIAGKMRLEMAQFRELEAFAQFSGDLDPETKKRIDRGRLMVEILKQDKHAPLGFEKQVMLIFAAVNDLLEGVANEKIKDAGNSFLEYADAQARELLNAIKEKRELGTEEEAGIKKTFEQWKSIHGNAYF